MIFEWDNRLDTGDREIDTHHKAFFVKANRLVTACRDGRGADELREMIKFLAGYAKHHFRAEEQRMAGIAYPYAATHQDQHQSFLARLEELSARLAKNGANGGLAGEVEKMTVAWLRDHILSSDLPLIERLREARGYDSRAG